MSVKTIHIDLHRLCTCVRCVLHPLIPQASASASVCFCRCPQAQSSDAHRASREATSEEVVLDVTIFFPHLCFHFGIGPTGTANAVQLCSSVGLDAALGSSSAMRKNQQPLVFCCECVLTLPVQDDSKDLTRHREAGTAFVCIDGIRANARASLSAPGEGG